MVNKEECSFCRNAIGQWHSELLMTDIGSDDIDDGFDYIRADVNITKHKTMVLQLTTDAGDEDIDEIDINFCPICGRDLRKEKEIKRLKEKLNSLYDPKMMTFNVKDSDGMTVVSNYCPLTGTSTTMVKIGYKHDDIGIAIAYLEGKIDGYKKRQQKPDDFAAVIKTLEAIKSFASERLLKHDN